MQGTISHSDHVSPLALGVTLTKLVLSTREYIIQYAQSRKVDDADTSLCIQAVDSYS